MGPQVIAAGGGEVIGDTPDRRVEILCEDDALHVTWSRFAAGRDGADLHIHRRHTDLFYVLDGEFTLLLADREVTLPAGELAAIPPLVVHGFRNASGAELRYLNLHAPGCRFADYLRSLRDGDPLSYDQEPPPASGTRPAEDVYVGGPDVAFDGIATAVGEPDTGGAGRLRCFYVLEGELAVQSGGRELRAGAGAWLQLPVGAEATVVAPARVFGVHAWRG